MAGETYYVVLGMKTYGGSFIKHLAEALEYADANNTRKIRDTWQEEWNHYYQMGLSFAKERGL